MYSVHPSTLTAIFGARKTLGTCAHRRAIGVPRNGPFGVFPYPATGSGSVGHHRCPRPSAGLRTALRARRCECLLSPTISLPIFNLALYLA